MFNYTKERNSYIYNFTTNSGTNYSVLFNPHSINITEVSLERNFEGSDDPNSIFEIMETGFQIANDHISVYPNVNTLVFNVIGDTSKEIDQKIKMYVKYSKTLNGNWSSEISDNKVNLKRIS